MVEMHRVWMGGEMPERYARYGEFWKDLNPDNTLHDWTEEEIMDNEWENSTVLDEMYSQSRRPRADMIAYYTHVVDVIDYELVYRYGGWYFNTDLKPIKPLSDLPAFDPDIPGFAMEDDVHAVNMAMYGQKHDPLFANIIENLPIRYFGMPGAYMNATTGVQLIMHTLGQYYGRSQLWHRDVFNPIHFTDFKYGGEPNTDIDFPDSTVAVHEWGHRTNQRGQRIVDT